MMNAKQRFHAFFNDLHSSYSRIDALKHYLVRQRSALESQSAYLGRIQEDIAFAETEIDALHYKSPHDLDHEINELINAYVLSKSYAARCEARQAFDNSLQRLIDGRVS